MTQLTFPSTFHFGVADADLQVIGEASTQKLENTPETMWHHFARTSGKCINNDSPAEGIDRYHRWKDDIALMQKLGVQHYRTSVSMSRILKRDGNINKEALAWYQTYFRALQQAGITIYVTLYHWELPQFLQEHGGWTNLKTADWLVKHTTTVYEQLGEYIEEYFLLNEPWTTVHLGYVLGVMAPGEKDLKKALLVAHNQLLIQGLMYRELIKHKQVKVSTVFNVANFYAASPDPNDILAASYGYGNSNEWYLDPLFKGTYPENMVALYSKSMPKISKADMEIIRIGDKLHALGLNYYFSNIVKYNKNELLHYEPVLKKDGLTNGLGWPLTAPPVYPEGFYELLMRIYATYKHFGLKKIYIAENGTAGDSVIDKKTKRVEDNLRIYYFQEHLRQLHKALLAGVPIEKYFLWTLMDNYEWQNGYGPEASFGIIHVDRKTMKRTLKKSALWYKKVLKTNTIPTPLVIPAKAGI